MSNVNIQNKSSYVKLIFPQKRNKNIRTSIFVVENMGLYLGLKKQAPMRKITELSRRTKEHTAKINIPKNTMTSSMYV